MNSKEKEHHCKKITYHQESEDTSLKIRCFNGNWVLHHFHFAYDQCVHDGEAQYEGEIMIICDVAINFCPYCGTLLNDKLSNLDEAAKQLDSGQIHSCSYLGEYNQKFPRV